MKGKFGRSSSVGRSRFEEVAKGRYLSDILPTAEGEYSFFE